MGIYEVTEKMARIMDQTQHKKSPQESMAMPMIQNSTSAMRGMSIQWAAREMIPVAMTIVKLASDNLARSANLFCWRATIRDVDSCSVGVDCMVIPGLIQRTSGVDAPSRSIPLISASPINSCRY